MSRYYLGNCIAEALRVVSAPYSGCSGLIPWVSRSRGDELGFGKQRDRSCLASGKSRQLGHGLIGMKCARMVVAENSIALRKATVRRSEFIRLSAFSHLLLRRCRALGGLSQSADTSLTPSKFRKHTALKSRKTFT